MKPYKTIKALRAAIDAGELDESQLTVVMDNDCSHVHYGTVREHEDNTVFRGNGYYDIEELWPALFPKATVEWC